MAMYPVLFITNRRVDYIMFSKDNRKFHTSPHVTATTLLLIGIIITSGTLFAFPLELFGHLEKVQNNCPLLASGRQWRSNL